LAPGHQWFRKKLSDEQGSVLVISLLIMAVLAILGAVASNMSITEMQSASNERRYNQTFYAAESAWQTIPNLLNQAEPDPAMDGYSTTITSTGITPVVTSVVNVTRLPEDPAGTVTPTAGGSVDAILVRYQVDVRSDNRQNLRVVLKKAYN
jgi:Tfp pilus assembly protein PilX